MEMPINVIIILFIAVVVGGAILVFTNTTLLKSQSELDKLRDDPASKDVVVELSAADGNTILNLANACVRKGRESGGLEKSICFAVFSGTFPSFGPLNAQALDDGFTLDTSAVSGSPSAVRIEYDPENRKVVVSP